MAAVARATGCQPDDVLAFLESRHGRHFADDVANGINRDNTPAHSIAIATAQWMGWTIGRGPARETGIPRGLPYLTGFVLHATIEANCRD